jgi:integrase/recombinase XerD
MIYRRHIEACSHRRNGRRWWQCACPIWFDARRRGLRIHKAMGTSDWGEAQSLADAWSWGGVGIAKTDPPETPSGKESLSLEDAWGRFLIQARVRKLSPATLCKYELLRRRMIDFARRRGLTLLSEFDLDTLEGFQAEWQGGALSCSKKMELLKSFFKAAFIRRWIDDNPSIPLQGPKPRPRPTLPFGHAEMSEILAAIEHYPDKSGKTGRNNAVRLRAFVLTLRYTGMRIGDVTSLDVNRLAGNKIFLYTQKTGVPVYCIVPDFVAEAWETTPRLSARYLFWTGNSTLHTAVGTWQRTLSRLFKLAGIPKGYAHRFRDTFSVELLLAGVPIEQVSILLGHNNIKVTQQHYSPWVRDRQRQLEADLQRAWHRDPVVLLQKENRRKRSTPNTPLPN